jgi:hypothetical protein
VLHLLQRQQGDQVARGLAGGQVLSVTGHQGRDGRACSTGSPAGSRYRGACRLTPRSRGDPQRHGAWAARPCRSIIGRAAQAPCRWGRLSSNVRRRSHAPDRSQQFRLKVMDERRSAESWRARGGSEGRRGLDGQKLAQARRSQQYAGEHRPSTRVRRTARRSAAGEEEPRPSEGRRGSGRLLGASRTRRIGFTRPRGPNVARNRERRAWAGEAQSATPSRGSVAAPAEYRPRHVRSLASASRIRGMPAKRRARTVTWSVAATSRATPTLRPRAPSNPSLESRPREAGRLGPAAGSQAHFPLPGQGGLPHGSAQLER